MPPGPRRACAARSRRRSAQGERLINQMDLVQREEFEAVRDMAAKARLENEALKKRLADLEARMPAPFSAPDTAV